ncbi:hypothetical protein [Alcaligenes sp.]|uniref:hypothetical protein n=1 Tax=Alcaligenes sp. TaxID=512 RepID=UPI003CFED9F8
MTNVPNLPQNLPPNLEEKLKKFLEALTEEEQKKLHDGQKIYLDPNQTLWYVAYKTTA